MTHTATRQIGIDMGHRVTNHGSKCRNVHGHRYTIEVTIGGELVPDGASEGMVLDFGFLKEEMMKEIDEPCDHGLCLWVKDPLLNLLFSPSEAARIREQVNEYGSDSVYQSATVGKMYIIDRVPTAENLAEHWFNRLQPGIFGRTEGRARILRIKVWETPNCFAEYSR